MLDTNAGAVGRPAPSRRELSGYHAWFLECARMVDRAPVAHVVVAERHARTDCLSPAPLEQLAALAAATSHVRLGTYVLQPPLYPPVALLERLAVIDHLSGGRLICGVGAGFHPDYFAVHERPMTGRGAALEEFLRLYREDWPHGRAGETYVPPPAQEPAPPLWVGGTSAPAVRRAARYADAFAIGFNDRQLSGLVERYRAECAEAGTAPRLVLIKSVWVRGPGTDAAAEAGALFADTFGPEMDLYRAHGQLHAAGAMHIERLLRYAYVGDTAEVLRRVHEDVQRWGVDEIVMRVHIGVPPREAVADCLTALVDEVISPLALR
ncbi:LLM class flavin-dependent oxidoreductase [Pseudonocardia kunmingensis]|uniref:Alkanesulfonate monooxygenase SsuD/methylene tetrahydromethanopterin reductase-like flavin-dependent oxidoreductase (Luciferase family) n=1 Tax=Pseudonocardia kunmingensis TaxID=630975 RepID=A0A543DLG3_9PSEU|nr:LLM class flavin-dependent oxidoreductase [Pseudonocardia kunmingensis]TQM10095.1 alkanesulfonate monooxygenase SsuD/methylene tetrahydromethanopterin reductase-like flavin-dependent oxidoreductase (luciferase family) [Pseudonocardia kunmingensis]